MIDQKNEALKNADSSALAEAIVSVLIEKKAHDVKMYNVGEENPMTDFYVNATGRSLTQVAALADELVVKIGECGNDNCKIEGKRGNSWILIDYVNVIVNLFDKESRSFYNLDRLMPEGSEADISAIVAAVDEKMKINNTEE